MTGNPGIPPGWVMLRCWTGWAIRDVAVNKMAAAGMNNSPGPADKVFVRFMMRKPGLRPFFAGATRDTLNH